MKSLCIFCGSSPGNDPDFVKSAQDLGKILAQRNITLIYGGASIGLMGAVADSALAQGGRVFGVLPRFMEKKEIGHKGLTNLFLCESMHERKAKMFELSEGFLALPGGFGTLEEIIEVLTWLKLGLHDFPVAFLNTKGFFNHIQHLFNEMERREFLKPKDREIPIFGEGITELLEKMENYGDLAP